MMQWAESESELGFMGYERKHRFELLWYCIDYRSVSRKVSRCSLLTRGLDRHCEGFPVEEERPCIWTPEAGADHE